MSYPERCCGAGNRIGKIQTTLKSLAQSEDTRIRHDCWFYTDFPPEYFRPFHQACDQVLASDPISFENLFRTIELVLADSVYVNVLATESTRIQGNQPCYASFGNSKRRFHI